MELDPSVALKIQDVMFDITANIKAIQDVLCSSGITDQNALASLYQRQREALDASPVGQRLEAMKSLLAFLRGN